MGTVSNRIPNSLLAIFASAESECFLNATRERLNGPYKRVECPYKRVENKVHPDAQLRWQESLTARFGGLDSRLARVILSFH